LRDIDDYEVYFAFSMSSRTADDVSGYDEDYIYMAYDDKLYEKETARRMLNSLISSLRQCTAHPETEVPILTSLAASEADTAAGGHEGAPHRDELGRVRLAEQATEFVNSALAAWQARLKAHAADYRKGT
jgi:hypothetical protein